MDMIRVQTMKEKDQNAPLDEEDEDDADEYYEGDIYIMMSVCVSVCHEKSSLPLQVCE